MHGIRFLHSLCVAACAPLLAAAQAPFPAKPVTLVVPVAPEGFSIPSHA
jgi:tripartite-type tricarboxylate transporter receptor subunit TctC